MLGSDASEPSGTHSQGAVVSGMMGMADDVHANRACLRRVPDELVREYAARALARLATRAAHREKGERNR